MIEVVYGQPPSPIVEALVEGLRSMSLHGTLYIAYPVLKSLDRVKTLDALLTCNEHGVVAFDLSTHRTEAGDLDHSRVQDVQDVIFLALQSKFQEHPQLRRRRQLAFSIAVTTFLPTIPKSAGWSEIDFVTPGTVTDFISQQDPLPNGLLEPLNAVIQRTAALRPRKRRENVSTTQSLGGILKSIEKEIANLDQWQKKAAIAYPGGPQRIRGLAGSGKTIVLAQKASFLHAQYPDWSIVVTFYTRSLYQQFHSLIRRFYFELMNDDPDWQKLQVLHSWGSSSSPGVYSKVAQSRRTEVRDFGYARTRYGQENAFSGICAEVLDAKHPPAPIFDAVLIDEAQDFPTEFFQLVYHATREPKRVVWAYDELQNLGDYSMAPAETLFGTDTRDQPRVSLTNPSYGLQQDIVLPVCYRNTPWALTVAHSLGFGIYRQDGIVQMFDDLNLWREIGYDVVSGDLSPGSHVSLSRRSEGSPDYFTKLLTPQDAVQCHVFDSFLKECEWVADSIARNLAEDELDHDDILIIYVEPTSTKRAAAGIAKALLSKGINSHLAGVTTSRDSLFQSGSVAITSIFRAKGNEAPMVYVMGAGTTISGFELAKKRNRLFTAITRSKGWVRISGVGSGMLELREEFRQVVEKRYRLEFTYPTDTEIEKMRRIHRDMGKGEMAELAKDMRSVKRLAQRIADGQIDISSLPHDVREMLTTIAQQKQ